MKKFIIHSLRFAIFLLVLLIIEDFIVTCCYHSKDTRKYGVWNDILHSNIDADLLILGNSRAWSQYSPQILDSILRINSYNIGLDGSAFNRQKARYDIYRHYQKKKPKYIIQNVEFFTLEGYSIGYEREQFMPYLMFPYYRTRIKHEEPFSFGELYIPMYRYYKNNIYDDFTKYDYIIQKGYYGREMMWDDAKLKSMKPYIANIDTTLLQLFTDYIEELQSDSIVPILVSAPVYTDATNVVLNINEINNLYKQIAEKYDILFLDYSSGTLSMDTTYFLNATHMNKLGAELFSLQLATDLDSLGIIDLE